MSTKILSAQAQRKIRHLLAIQSVIDPSLAQTTPVNLSSGVAGVFTITQQIASTTERWSSVAPSLADVYVSLYQSLHTAARWPDILEYWPIAITIARDSAAPVQVATLLLQQGTVASNCSRMAEAEACFREGITRLELESSPQARSILAHSLFQLGACFVDQGKNYDALPILERCRQLCEAIRDYETAAYVTSQLGNAQLQLGLLSESEATYRAGLAAWQALGEVDRRAHISWYGLGKKHIFAGEYAQAAEALSKSLALKQASDSTDEGIANCQQWLGFALVKLRRLDEGEALLKQALAYAERSSDRECLVSTQIALALVFRAKGNVDAAVKHLQQALQTLEATRIAAQKLRIALYLLPLLLKTRQLTAAFRLCLAVPGYLHEQQLGVRDVTRIAVKLVTRRIAY